jgi:hypothetical protein
MERRQFIGRLLAVLGGLFAAGTGARAATRGRGPVGRGYGPCKHRSCDCYKFDGKGNTCKCGHSFYDHR